MTSPHCIVLVTCPDHATGEKIAAQLVDEQLAACVNVQGNITSFYRWEGKLEREAEVLLIIKTRNDLFASVETRVKSLHPYEVPEIVALNVTKGNEKYLNWIDASTRTT